MWADGGFWTVYEVQISSLEIIFVSAMLIT